MSGVFRLRKCSGGVGVQEATISAVSSNKFKDYLLYCNKLACFVVNFVASVHAGLQLADLEMVCTSCNMNDLHAQLE